MTENARFLADPFLFCLNNALHPQDIQGGVGARKPGNYFSVPGDQRVKWCQIVPGAQLPYGFSCGVNSGCFSATVSSTAPVGPDAANWFTVYYLPWAANETFRITLKNRQGLTDPDIFLTSAVDGCSVFVEGDPAEPTVYHANNAAGTPPGPGSTQAAWNAYYDPKRTSMETRVNQTHSPKSVRQDPGLLTTTPSKGVHASEYMDLVHAQRPGFETDAGKKSARDEVKAANPKLKKIKVTSTDYKPCGTVFGWRRGGRWTFYYQKRAIMYFLWEAKKKGIRGGKETGKPPVCREYALDCWEFWPNGKGRVFARAVVPHPDPFKDWLQDFN